MQIRWRIPGCSGDRRGRSARVSLGDGRVSFVVSDHSPATPEERAGDPFSAWGGIAGCQSTLELLLTEDRLSPSELVRAWASAAARRFRLAGKGALEVGGDGDVVLVRLGDPHGRLVTPFPMLWFDRARRRGTLQSCSRGQCNTGSIRGPTACLSRCC